jgi:hypothetical protein
MISYGHVIVKHNLTIFTNSSKTATSIAEAVHRAALMFIPPERSDPGPLGEGAVSVS